jgi:hypothetical protein
MKLDWKQLLKILAWILTAIAGGAGGAAMMQPSAGIELKDDGTVTPYEAGTDAVKLNFIISAVETLTPADNPGLPVYKIPDGFTYVKWHIYRLTLPQWPNEKQLIVETRKRGAKGAVQIASVTQVDRFFYPLQPGPGGPIEDVPPPAEDE